MVAEVTGQYLQISRVFIQKHSIICTFQKKGEFAVWSNISATISEWEHSYFSIISTANLERMDEIEHY